MRDLGGTTAQAILGAAMALAATACTSLDPAPGTEGMKQLDVATQRPHTRFAQMSFGRDVVFALCVEPACPKVTPKTLAPEELAMAGSAQMPESTRAAIINPRRHRTQAPATLGAAEARDSAGRPKPVARPGAARVVIHFSPGSAELSPEARKAVAASLAGMNSARRIVIAGRGDAGGLPAADDPLMLRRAMAVRSHVLDTAPRSASAVSIDASGSCCFGNEATDVGQRPLSNRLEIVFTSHEAAN